VARKQQQGIGVAAALRAAAARLLEAAAAILRATARSGKGGALIPCETICGNGVPLLGTGCVLYSKEQTLAWLIQEVGIRIRLVYYTISYTIIAHHLTRFTRI
jgi:hypothetical protein